MVSITTRICGCIASMVAGCAASGKGSRVQPGIDEGDWISLRDGIYPGRGS